MNTALKQSIIEFVDNNPSLQKEFNEIVSRRPSTQSIEWEIWFDEYHLFMTRWVKQTSEYNTMPFRVIADYLHSELMDRVKGK